VATAQTVFLNFSAPGQLTNDFNLWNDDGTGTNASEYSFEENTNGGITIFQDTDTTATYKNGSWNLATSGATALVSALVQANGQSSGDAVQLGFINSASNGFYSYRGIEFESFLFIPASSTNWTLHEQRRSKDITSESGALGTVSIVPGHWYRFVVGLTNYGGSFGGLVSGCALYDRGANGATPGTDRIAFSTYQYHAAQSLATNKAVWPALRVTEGGGISTWDDFLVYTAESAPVFTVPLTNGFVLENSPVAFTALADGPGTISYVWRTNGLLLPGPSPTSRTIARMPAGSTLVSVVARNAKGSVTNEATMTGIIPMTPVAVTGFNRDVVIESNAPGPPYGAYAAELAPGSGTCFYEQGLPGTYHGLPASGVFNSVLDLTQFQFQSYTANNAMVVSSETGASNGTLTLVTPAAFRRIAVLADSAGGGPASTGSLTLQFADGSTYDTNYNAAGWIGNSGFALQGVDEISLTNGVAQGGPANPRFYQTTINLAAIGATNKFLSSLTFGQSPGAAATAVYAVSGLVSTNNPFALALVSNSPASDIAWNSATIGGSVAVTGGDVPKITLYYGPADGGVKVSAWAKSIPLGYQSGAFSRTLDGLSPGSTYYYICQASNIAGTSWAAPSLSFTTVAATPPQVTNLPAANITGQSATLAANVLNTGGLTPTITLFYGPTDGTTNVAAWASSLNLGPESGYAAVSVGALASNTSYYFTARGSNSQGVVWAAPSQSFLTLPANPASTLSAMLTYHNDNARDGVNSNETQLTPANVNTNTFGRLFSCSVDGYVYAQPLVMTNVLIPGKGLHNVVYVATEHDSVYAFDADSNQGDNARPLWQVSFIDPARGVTTVPSIEFDYADIKPEAGITATPVIDPATGTLYVEARTREPGPVYKHRLHALDITTGAERVSGAVSNSPAIIAATNYPGTGNGDNDGHGHVLWNGLRQHSRPALTLLNGVVYVGYASLGDENPYHGWLFAYNAQSLAQLSVYNTTPNGLRGGIWQGGGGLTVDESGNFYFATGNGYTSNDFNATGATFSQANNNFAMSVLKFTPSNGVPRLVDFFSPFNQAALTAKDLDLGSGAALVLPDSAGSSAHPHLLVAGGKTGTIYLLDRDNLGHFNAASDAQAVQVLPNVLGFGSFSTPAFFNQNLYYVGVNSPMLAFSVTGGLISTAPPLQTAETFGSGGCGSPSVSANGSSNAIVWVMDSDAWFSSGPGVLRAYNATNIAQELYNSSMLLSRDNPGAAVKFCVPTVVDGKVYVGAEYAISVFGLTGFLAAPGIQPNGGSFSNTLTVSLYDPSPGASLYYTLDGSAPSTNSTLYTVPFVLTNSTLLQVVAASQGAISEVASASFLNTAAPGSGQGLLAAYYSARLAAFTPPPTLVRTDAVIDFDWKTTPPSPAVNRTEFSVRWTGCVQPQYSETYTFTTWTDAGARLWINGQLLINAWSNQPPTAHRVSIPLVARQLYNIEMDYYYHEQGEPVAQLSWSSPSTPEQIIPQSQLYPVSNSPPSVLISAPTNGEVLPAGASFTFSAAAAAQFNDLSQVFFYIDGQLAGTATNLPFALTEPSLSPGGHALTAVAEDATGQSSTSPAVNITVATMDALVLIHEFTDGKRHLLMRGVSGSNRVLQASSNLTQWVAISTNSVSTNPVLLSDPGSNGAAYRFYRVQPQP
jgi:hypothetical protein